MMASFIVLYAFKANPIKEALLFFDANWLLRVAINYGKFPQDSQTQKSE